MKTRLLIIIGIILFEFGMANMLIGFPINEQIIDPFPMTILDWHFPFHYKFVGPAMYFQDDGSLYFDHYWMLWSLSIYFGLSCIVLWCFRFHRENKRVKLNS